MTDVDGPPAPPERFSSLLIRGASRPAAEEGSKVEVGCDMVRAFEIPAGSRTATRMMLSRRSHRGFPDKFYRHSQPARPVRTDQGNMGRSTCPRKRASKGAHAASP